MSERRRLAVGAMTGTSLDGLDLALVELIGEGLCMQAELVRHHAAPLGDELRAGLRGLADGEAASAFDMARLANLLGQRHAEAIGAMLSDDQADHLSFCCVHGQTVAHRPDHGVTWQLLNPWPITHRIGKPVCYDLRGADVASGGQGAPITPLADLVLLRPRVKQQLGVERFVVANLGGVCNLTWIDGDTAAGADVGPCNLLLDGLCRRFTVEAYDVDGRLAVSGQPNLMLALQLVALIAEASGTPENDEQPRTLGREQFDAAWLDRICDNPAADGVEPPDLLRTACEAVAHRIVDQANQGAPWGEDSEPGPLVLAGGGARNAALVQALVEHAEPAVVLPSDDLGVPAEAREAMAMAVLGGLCADGVPVTLPSVTGATKPALSGAWAGGTPTL